MKILFSVGNVPLEQIPADIPPQNIFSIGLVPGSSTFCSAFNDQGEVIFKQRAVEGVICFDLPLEIDWKRNADRLSKEVSALMEENAKLRMQLIGSPLGSPQGGIIRP